MPLADLAPSSRWGPSTVLSWGPASPAFCRWWPSGPPYPAARPLQGPQPLRRLRPRAGRGRAGSPFSAGCCCVGAAAIAARGCPPPTPWPSCAAVLARRCALWPSPFSGAGWPWPLPVFFCVVTHCPAGRLHHGNPGPLFPASLPARPRRPLGFPRSRPCRAAHRRGVRQPAAAAGHPCGAGAFGGGDIQLMAVCGFLLGWKQCLAGFFPGAAHRRGAGGLLLASGRAKTGQGAHMPFGPALCASCFLSLLWGGPLVAWYMGFFQF